MSRLRVAVLASGRGSNLAALLAARARGELDIELAAVASDRPAAPALAIAREAGLDALAFDPKGFQDRLAFDRALFGAVGRVQPDLIVCAGYMRLVSAAVVAEWSGRMINLHPSLLPAYPGLRTHARALADGVVEHGASVHFVTADLDAGPVIAQVRIPIEPGDTPERLAARLLPHEHRLLVASVGLFAAGRVAMVGDRVRVDEILRERPLELTADGRLA
jgi:phosphoribosylglycinamide formyltransferase-1